MSAKKNKKILLLGSLPPPYHGSSIYLMNLYGILKKDPEFDVSIIDTSDKRNDISNLGKYDIANVLVAIKSIIKLIIVLIQNRPEIVYIPVAQSTPGYLRDGIFILISKIFHVKVLIHLHGSFFRVFYESTNVINKCFINLTMRSVNSAIVLGEKLRYIFIKWLEEEKIFSLPNFIIPPKGYLIREKKENILDITYLGNIIESKGIFEFLEAIKILKKSDAIRINVIGKFGDDPSTKLSEKDIKAKFFNIIEDIPNLIYHGMIQDQSIKYKLLLETDIFIFPSWYPYEGQPLVILEAMLCGCPIISTREVGVIEETVIDGENGILIEKKNVVQLAAAIKKLINNADLRKKMGEASIKRFNGHYTVDMHIKKFKKILVSL